jgi:hypothetical protein
VNEQVTLRPQRRLETVDSDLCEVRAPHAGASAVHGFERSRLQSSVVPGISIQRIEQRRPDHSLEGCKGERTHREWQFEGRSAGADRGGICGPNPSGRTQSLLTVRPVMVSNQRVQREAGRTCNRRCAQRLAVHSRQFERTAGSSMCTAGSSISEKFIDGNPALNCREFSQSTFDLSIEPRAVSFLDLPRPQADLGPVPGSGLSLLRSIPTLTRERSNSANWQQSHTRDLDELVTLLSITTSTLETYLRDAKRDEKDAQKAKAWDLWLDCLSEREIAEKVGVDQATAHRWIDAKPEESGFASPPESRQHFDVWSFSNGGDGQSSATGGGSTAGSRGSSGIRSVPRSHLVEFFPPGAAHPTCSKGRSASSNLASIRESSPISPRHLTDITETE